VWGIFFDKVLDCQFLKEKKDDGYTELKKIQGDQKFSMHLMITIEKSGAQRLFDHPVYTIFKPRGHRT
jgi:hypothetical protein